MTLGEARRIFDDLASRGAKPTLFRATMAEDGETVETLVIMSDKKVLHRHPEDYNPKISPGVEFEAFKNPFFGQAVRK